MAFALVLRELSGRWKLLIVGVLLALFAATLSVYRPDGFKLKPRSLQYAAASTQVMVDTSSTVLGNSSLVFDGPNARATVFANFMTSPAVLNLIGQKAGIPGDQIYAAGPVNTNVPRIIQEPTDLKRNVEITGETAPYRLNLNTDPDLPIINIYSQAPTTAQAIALANGAVSGLDEFITGQENADRIQRAARVVVKPLGTANGGVVNPGIRKSLAAIVFVAVFVLWCVLVLVGARFRKSWKASAALYNPTDEQSQRSTASASEEDLWAAVTRNGGDPEDAAATILRSRYQAVTSDGGDTYTAVAQSAGHHSNDDGEEETAVATPDSGKEETAVATPDCDTSS